MQVEKLSKMDSKLGVEVDELLEEENHNDINEEICNKPLFDGNIQ
jgi:hypothetical protein